MNLNGPGPGDNEEGEIPPLPHIEKQETEIRGDGEEKTDDIKSNEKFLKLIAKELRLLGTKFLIRLVVRIHERMVEEIISNEMTDEKEKFRERYTQVLSFLAERGLESEEMPLLVNFHIGFNSLRDITVRVIRALFEDSERSRNVAPSSIKNALSELEKHKLIVHMRVNELNEEIMKRVEKYVKQLIEKYIDTDSEDEKMKAYFEIKQRTLKILKRRIVLGRSIIYTPNPEFFDMLYGGFINPLLPVFRNTLGKELRKHVECKLDTLEEIVNNLRALEASLQKPMKATLAYA